MFKRMPMTRRRWLVLAGALLAALAARPVALAASASPSAPSASPSATTTTTTALPAPPPGGQRLVLISDLNAQYGATSYIPEVHRGVALITRLRPDLVLCAGDMVAGQKPGLPPARLAAMWSAFDRQILAPIRQAGVPFLPALGNHDASSLRQAGGYRFAADRQEAERFWRQRQGQLGLAFADPAGFPFFYSVRRGDLFVLVWDASSATVPPEQLRWAERALASPAARTARRRLAIGHLPLQAVAQGRDSSGDVLAAGGELRRLLERHRVQAYISGHQHAYFPSRLGQLDLVQLGALGSGPRRLLGRSDPPYQTLTVLDLPAGAAGAVETTLNLRSGAVVARRSLPDQVVDASGRVLPRRDR